MVRAHHLALFASLSWLACRSDGTGLDPGADASAGPAAAQACAQDARAYCEKRQTCWPEGENDYRFQRDWGTLQGCIDQRQRTCLDDVERPHAGLTTTRVQTCARAMADQSCEDFLAGIALPTSACPPVVGKLGNGVACVAGNQCQSSYCDRADDQVCGKCADCLGIGRACDSERRLRGRPQLPDGRDHPGPHLPAAAAGRAAREAGRALWRGRDAGLRRRPRVCRHGHDEDLPAAGHDGGRGL